MRWNGQSTFPVPRRYLCLSGSIFTLQQVESSLKQPGVASERLSNVLIGNHLSSAGL